MINIVVCKPEHWPLHLLERQPQVLVRGHSDVIAVLNN